MEANVAGVSLEVTEGAHVWTLEDWPITQLTIDPGRVRLMVGKLHGSAEVRIGVPFRFTRQGSITILDPANPPSLSPLLTLIGTPLYRVHVAASGGLQLTIGDVDLGVDAHPRFEAWEAQGEGAFDAFSYRSAPVTQGGSHTGGTGSRSPWGTRR